MKTITDPKKKIKLIRERLETKCGEFVSTNKNIRKIERRKEIKDLEAQKKQLKQLFTDGKSESKVYLKTKELKT
jgi:hypothetical protein